jgi:hypothetical protein
MNDPNTATRECGNEACFRPAEPGEPFCAACGLEISLFDRDARREGIEAAAWRLREERRG